MSNIKMTKIVVDHNLILEAWINRSRFGKDATNAYNFLETQSFQGYISYLGFKKIYDTIERLGGLEIADRITSDIKDVVIIHNVEYNDLQKARSLNLDDYYNAMEIVMAQTTGIGAILTLNPQAFSGSAVPIRIFTLNDLCTHQHHLYVCQVLESLLQDRVRSDNCLHNNFAQTNPVWQKFEDVFSIQPSYRYIRKNRKFVKTKKATTIQLDDGLQLRLGLHFAECFSQNWVNILVHLNVLGDDNYLPEKIRFMITDAYSQIFLEALPEPPEIGRILEFEAERGDSFTILVEDERSHYRESVIVE